METLQKPEIIDNHLESNNQQGQFIEVLGDTAKGSSLISSVIIGLVCSFGLYILGQKLFPLFVEEKMVASYSLFLGIAGTVVSLIINSLLFKPSRVLTEDTTTPEGYSEVLKSLDFDVDEEYEVFQNDPVIRKEMESFGITLDQTSGGGKKWKY